MAAERNAAHQMLHPSRLLQLARTSTLPSFAADRETRRILLVRTPPLEHELSAELRRLFGAKVIHTRDSQENLDLRSLVTEMVHASGGLHSGGSSSFGKRELVDWMLAAPCIAVPLLQRGDAESRIVVGRSRTAHLPLRARSVSKIHAYFEPAPNNGMRLSDPGSRNGTYVNGTRIGVGKSVDLRRGDTLRFGEVEAVISPTEVFWNAVQ